MEDLEQSAMESASAELRPTLWKRYVDDTLEVIKRGKVDAWSAHLNNMDPTGSIKFIHEKETDNTIAFLDTLLERKEDGSVKVKVYRRKHIPTSTWHSIPTIHYIRSWGCQELY